MAMVKILLAMIAVYSLACSCKQSNGTRQPADARAVQQMMQGIAQNITEKGPTAWLDYFEKSPGFIMASDGALAFADNEAATVFVRDTLPNYIRKVRLRWSDIRVDVLTPGFAGIAANFHEDITNREGKTMPEHGYFTAVAHKTNNGWQLRSLHWSVIHR